MKHVAIRADASLRIGTGHMMRCLALAQVLRQTDHQVRFFSRPQPGDLINTLKDQGFTVTSLSSPCAAVPQTEDYASWLGAPWQDDVSECQKASSADLDWLIVDHYGIERQWEQRARSFARQIMVIDDLANRPHDCDVLLDTGPFEKAALRYINLMPSQSRGLFGPDYLPLSSSLAAAMKHRSPRSGDIKHVLLFMGGSDPKGLTSIVLDAIESLSPRPWTLTVIGGTTNRANGDLADRLASWKQTTFTPQTSDMATLLSQTDFAIGGGGVAALERVLLGVPSLVIPWADNQIPAATELARQKVIALLPREEALAARLRERLAHYLATPADVRALSEEALRRFGSVDGQGAYKIVQELQSIPCPR